MIRIAAAGDMHYDRHSQGTLSPYLRRLRSDADLLLLAGDLTRSGHLEEALLLAQDLKECGVPVIATFGNHDYHQDKSAEIASLLKEAGVRILERDSLRLTVNGLSVGIVGAKGFGGGFLGACGSDFGEPEMKAFIRHTKAVAQDIKTHLAALDTAYRIVLLHYAPVVDTLLGERKEIYPFLGSYLLAEAIDEVGADIIFHGHAHRGTEKGVTAGGIPVRNVAQPVLGHVFNIYTLNKEGEVIAHSAMERQQASPSGSAA